MGPARRGGIAPPPSSYRRELCLRRGLTCLCRGLPIQRSRRSGPCGGLLRACALPGGVHTDRARIFRSRLRSGARSRRPGRSFTRSPGSSLHRGARHRAPLVLPCRQSSMSMLIRMWDTAEGRRLDESRRRAKHWKRWGPYLAERAWGTVREDYSLDGRAWEYFPHDQAQSRAYRWNEDGLAGISDRHQSICFALALWNGRDPILKERLFGLGGDEGNHGEDVKECYFYLDNTPTHSYMKYLYKYPQAAFPYTTLVAENARRDRTAPEYELIDTGVFEEDRYFDVQVEYAKADV